MSTQGKRLWVAAVLGLVLSFFWAERAEALFIYNTGEAAFETGPLPAPFDQNPQYQGFKAGYKCSVFGLFWAYVYTWDCKAVAFKEEGASQFRYFEEPELSAAIAAQYPQDTMKMGFWAKHGRWIVLLLIVGFIGLRIFIAVKKRS